LKIAAIVPSAGRGSRLLPFPCPKELFPVGYQDVEINGAKEKRPKVVSQYLIEHLVRAGAERVFLILGDGKGDIMRYYGDGKRFGTNISYLYQEQLHGMPLAIDLARPFLNDETILFGMPDTIIQPLDLFSTLLDYHVREAADLTLALFPTDNPSKFGMVEIDADNNVVRQVDKPKQTDLRLMWGACAWSPAFTALIGEYLDKSPFQGKEIVLGDIFDEALRRKMTVKGLAFEDGKYIDIGTTGELNLALQQFNF